MRRERQQEDTIGAEWEEEEEEQKRKEKTRREPRIGENFSHAPLSFLVRGAKR
ncbi:hypothetical protein V8C34DRAFT_288462 [Trichoderma compactum]